MNNWTTKRWINGAELMDALGIAPYELLAFIKDGLQVNDEYGRTLLFFKEPTPSVVLKMMGWVYYGKDQETIVEEIETKKFYVKHVLQYLAGKNLLHLVPYDPTVEVEQPPQDLDAQTPNQLMERARSRSRPEQKELAKRLREEGRTRQEIAERLYPHDTQTVDIESLKKRVDRLK